MNFDSIGKIFLAQSPRGAKASVDGLLLARFVRAETHWRVADLGCGNGLVALVMAADKPSCSVLGVEVQEPLVRQAREGARRSGLANVAFVRADLRHSPWRPDLGRFDLVAANPPYRKVGTGRLSPDPVRAAARHELLGSLADFAAAAASLLRDGCSSAWVYLAERKDHLLRTVAESGLEPVRIREVLPRSGQAPSLVLLEAVKGEGIGRMYEEEPLVLYRSADGRDYTDEARGMIYGES